MADEFAARVRAVRTVGPDAVAIDIETPDGFDALPGQFVLLQAAVEGEELDRYYTVSSPDVEETFEVTVGVDPEGDLSPWLADRDPGDELRFTGPFGNVSYDDEGDVVVLAGGPGVGPAIGIGERAARAGHAVSIVYRDDDHIHEGRLESLAGAGANVVFLDADEVLDDAVADVVDRGTVYVIGFQDFCDEAVAAIEAAGGDPDDALVESFG